MHAAEASHYRILYAFTGGADGAHPRAGLIRNTNGDFYGTALSGGDAGFGTVFELSRRGEQTTLYSFLDQEDGANPHASVISDEAGNLYGTAFFGGLVNSFGGTVFKLGNTGQEMTLHEFSGGTDGGNPAAPLIRDADGNLYGTTVEGGSGCYPSAGCGVAFLLDSAGREHVLHTFAGGRDGQAPIGGLVRDRKGTLYGTTFNGGAGRSCDSGCGVVFRIASDGKEKVLYAFRGGSDGANPYAGLIRDDDGNLYGTTSAGGSSGNGTVFKASRNGSEVVLHSFTGSDGATPYGGVIRDKLGNLYGTTNAGGDFGLGTIFELAPDGTETVLHSFAGGDDGASPYAGLIMGRRGHLYGTTFAGGPSDAGVVFKLKP